MRLANPEVLVAGATYTMQGSFMEDSYTSKQHGVKELMFQAGNLMRVRAPKFNLKECTHADLDYEQRKQEPYPSSSFLGLISSVGEQTVMPKSQDVAMRTVEAVVKLEGPQSIIMTITLFAEHAKVSMTKGDVVFFGNAGVKSYQGRTVCSMNQYSALVVNPDWSRAA